MFVPVANQQTQDPLTSKMAPWPETGTEPKEPDKTNIKTSESDLAEAAAVDITPTEVVEGGVTTVEAEDKQTDDKLDPDVSTLNDGQLKELLDEALSYRNPTDRVGKSPLFRELLEVAESDKTECGDDRSSAEASASRILPRRRGGGRHHASAASPGETHGGSLQNLVQALSTEFVNDNNQFYSSGAHGGGSRNGRKLRRSGKDYGVSVSARQREGGSLPIDVGNSDLKTLLFEDVRTYDAPPFVAKVVRSAEPTYPDCRPKEFAQISDYRSAPAKEFDYAAKASDYPQTLKSVFGMEAPEKRSESCVIDVEDAVAKDAGRKLNKDVLRGGEGDGTEMEEVKRQGEVVNYTTHATLEVGMNEVTRVRDSERDVDTTVSFPLLPQSALVNGTISSTIQLPASYTAVGSLLENEDQGNNKGLSSTDDTKYSSSYTLQPQMSTVSVMPHKKDRGSWFSTSTYTGDSITKLSFQSMDDMKNKTVDENGNALTNIAAERKAKLRKAKPKPNHKEYFAEQVTGHRGEEDIDLLLKFIESDKERKSKAGGNPANHRGATVLNNKATKIRDRKLPKSEDGTSADTDKLKRSNSLEEVSRTKLEDLTSSESTGVVRRPKKQSTFDDVDLRGDRRSWGTEEGQQYYCTDAAVDDAYPAARRKRRDRDDQPVLPAAQPVEDTEFCVVTKKQRRKKRRSSSGGRGDFLDDGRRSQYGQGQREKGCELHPRGKGGTSGFPPHDRDVLYQYRRPRSPDLRRKSTSSMPPSDKSDSSDLDSVHSLPASATTPIASLDHSGSSGSAPLASYADIAKISSAAPANINVNATKWPAITGYYAHNSQFITSSKVNIGAPPVSGSRSHAASVTSASNDALSLAGANEEAAKQDATEMQHHKPRADPRPKKGAVCNVPLNFKVIPPYENDDCDFDKSIEEDSSIKLTKNTIPLEDFTDSTKNVVPLAISNNNDVVIVRKNSKHGVHNETMVNAVQVIDDKSDVASAVNANHEDISVAKSVLGDNKGNVRDSDSVAKDVKGIAVCKKGPNDPVVSHCMNPRPAVIILDEKESVSVNEKLTSEITFGFEINELLLMSEEENSVEGLCLNSNYVGDRTLNNVHSATPRVFENKPRKAVYKGVQKNSKINMNQSKLVSKTQTIDTDACENHLAQFASTGQVSPTVCDNRLPRNMDACAVDAPNADEENIRSGNDTTDTDDALSSPTSLGATSDSLVGRGSRVTKAADDFAARFRQPAECELPTDHNTLVSYISLAWDGILSSGGVTYYSDLSG